VSEHVTDEVDPTTDSWVALFHEPGPEAPKDEALVMHPLFAEHLAFLERMKTRGLLVAAGPIAGSTGSGMTILRMRGPERFNELALLATEDDKSVTGGLLTVSFRPWKVLLTG
jgi:uncharacterized protein YciI